MFTSLCKPLSPCVGWTQWLGSNKQNTVKGMGCHFWDYTVTSIKDKAWSLSTCSLLQTAAPHHACFPPPNVLGLAAHRLPTIDLEFYTAALSFVFLKHLRTYDTQSTEKNNVCTEASIERWVRFSSIDQQEFSLHLPRARGTVIDAGQAAVMRLTKDPTMELNFSEASENRCVGVLGKGIQEGRWFLVGKFCK